MAQTAVTDFYPTIDDSNTPPFFVCPITYEVMEDPVIDNEGVSYEKEAITNWLSQGKMTSPVTQNPLRVENLRPNVALKEAIAEYVGREGALNADSSVERNDNSEKSNLPLHVGINIFYDGTYVMVNLTPPAQAKTTPSSICCVVDISGSMDSPAVIQDEKGKEEQYGLTVLDITKHALKTIVKSLGTQDEFSLVTFDGEARVELEPMLMTERNVEEAMSKIEGLKTLYATNLWAGLEEGLNLLMKNKPLTENVALFLLTDGLPNISPEGGEVKCLQVFRDEKCSGQLPCRINTFGFGYEMDSVLLTDLASIGGGCYSFIPDCGFVGTVFVNSVANHLTTVASNISLNITSHGMTLLPGDYVRNYDAKVTQDNEVTINFGSIQCDQSKDIVFPVKLNPDQGTPRIVAILKHQTSKGEKTIGATIFDLTDTEEENDDIKYHLARMTLVNAITEALEVNKQKPDKQSEYKSKKVAKGLKILKRAQKQMCRWSPKKENGRFIDLMKDLTGQIQEAFSKKEYYQKWGRHYCLSIKSAHLYQFCNNFKDAGVQHYASKLFMETREGLDDVFINLPAPTPSIGGTEMYGLNGGATGGSNGRGIFSNINMSRFMNLQGGCFLGKSRVNCPGQKFIRVDSLKKGDLVLTGTGQIDEIECVMKTVFGPNQEISLCVINESLITTSWHPVKTEKGEWKFPVEIAMDFMQIRVACVYSFLLKSRGTVLIGDTECATLGHGLQGDVIGHSYFGTEAVVRDLKRSESFFMGLVEVRTECFKRHESSAKVVAILV